MAQIMVIDTDKKTLQLLEEHFRDEEKIKFVYFSTPKEIINLLNGQPEKKEAAKVADEALKVARGELEKNETIRKAAEGKFLAERDALKKLEEKRKQTLEQIEKNRKAAPDVLGPIQAAMKQITDQMAQVIDRAKSMEIDLGKATDIVNQFKADGEKKKKIWELAAAKVPTAEQETYDLVLIDASYLGAKPQEWMTQFRGSLTYDLNKNIPVAIISHNENPLYIRNFLIPGIFDYFIKPFDKLHIVQNVKMILAKGGTVDKEVFTLQTQATVEVAFPFEVSGISELDVTVKSSKAFSPNEFVTFYGDMFSTGTERRVFTRCTRNDKVDGEEAHMATFCFVGISDLTRKQIRKWLREAYIKKKSEGLA